MPFQEGNTLATTRKSKKGGAPKKTEVEIKQAAAEIAKEFIESNIKPVLNNYLRLANGWLETRWSENGTEYDTFVYDGATTRHFIDKVLPNEQTEAQRPISINFVQYHNTLQLHAEGVSVAVLAGNGNGHQASGNGVASPVREGQNSIKFSNFKDVP